MDLDFEKSFQRHIQFSSIGKSRENEVGQNRNDFSLEFYGKTKDSQNFPKKFAPLHFHEIFVCRSMKIEPKIKNPVHLKIKTSNINVPSSGHLLHKSN